MCYSIKRDNARLAYNHQKISDVNCGINQWPSFWRRYDLVQVLFCSSNTRCHAVFFANFSLQIYISIMKLYRSVSYELFLFFFAAGLVMSIATLSFLSTHAVSERTVGVLLQISLLSIFINISVFIYIDIIAHKWKMNIRDCLLFQCFKVTFHKFAKTWIKILIHRWLYWMPSINFNWDFASSEETAARNLCFLSLTRWHKKFSLWLITLKRDVF